MNELLLIEIGKYFLNDKISLKKPSEANKIWLEAGKYLWDLYSGRVKVEDKPGLLLANRCSRINNTCCEGCSEDFYDMAYSTSETNAFMYRCLFTILEKNDHDVQDLFDLRFVRNHTKEDELKELINTRMMAALTVYYPNQASLSLTEMCVKVVSANKFSKFYEYGANLVWLPDSLFVKHPELEVNGDRFVRERLRKFLADYQPVSMEFLILKKLQLCLTQSGDLYKSLHITLNETDFKNYTAYMKKFISKPLVNLMKQFREQKISADYLRASFEKIMSTYQLECHESNYLQRIDSIVFSADTKVGCDVQLKALLEDEALNGAASQTFIDRIRTPLVNIYLARNELVKEKNAAKLVSPKK